MIREGGWDGSDPLPFSRSHPALPLACLRGVRRFALTLEPAPTHVSEGAQLRGKMAEGRALEGGVMVQFPKAAEKFPPPRFSVPQIPLESIGFIILNGLSPGRRLSFQRFPRMSKRAINPVSISSVPEEIVAYYPTSRLLDKMNPPAASARRGCWNSRPGTGS